MLHIYTFRYLLFLFSICKLLDPLSAFCFTIFFLYYFYLPRRCYFFASSFPSTAYSFATIIIDLSNHIPLTQLRYLLFKFPSHDMNKKHLKFCFLSQMSHNILPGYFLLFKRAKFLVWRSKATIL